ncbi:MAG: hypothetical protein AAFR47_08695 [Pseudomonadota bacterium]
MGFCIDQSTRFLRDQGYNVVRLPAEGLAPLDIFGIIDGTPMIVGTVADLVEEASGELPAARSGQAANIEGKRTSRMPVSIGIDILGAVLSGLGGNIGVKAAFETARTLQFTFKKVTRDLVVLADAGAFIESGTVRWDAMGIREFLSPGGRLFLVTEVLKSPAVGVSAFARNKAEIAVDVPAIEAAIGSAEVNVATEGENGREITFAGAVALVFGFKCMELAVTETPSDPDELRLTFKPVRPGEVALGAERDNAAPALLSESGLIGGLPRRAP